MYQPTFKNSSYTHLAKDGLHAHPACILQPPDPDYGFSEIYTNKNYEGCSYVVQSGDGWESLAESHGLTGTLRSRANTPVPELKALNPRAGDMLFTDETFICFE